MKGLYNRMSTSGVSVELKPVYLEDLMPTELQPRYGLEKHTLREYAQLKGWFDRMIFDYKNKKSIRPARGLHELEERRPEGTSEQGELNKPGDNMLYSLL